jgi:hypothetical protein
MLPRRSALRFIDGLDEGAVLAPFLLSSAPHPGPERRIVDAGTDGRLDARVAVREDAADRFLSLRRQFAGSAHRSGGPFPPRRPAGSLRLAAKGQTLPEPATRRGSSLGILGHPFYARQQVEKKTLIRLFGAVEEFDVQPLRRGKFAAALLLPPGSFASIGPDRREICFKASQDECPIETHANSQGGRDLPDNRASRAFGNHAGTLPVASLRVRNDGGPGVWGPTHQRRAR